ncbi:MAG: molybdopterin-dependent oxidoreductase [Thermoleophilia bacterium]|nr:molybdopterin-dependent oxidoreductase [Thermoleophilia bacterium]
MIDARRTVRSSCRMCHGVCQVLVHLEGDRVVRVTGDPDSPTSRGYICAKGRASPELLYHPDRLTHPLRRVGARGEGRWERVSWDDALDEIAARILSIRDESGAEFVGLCQGTGRPYIEFTQRFIYAFGSPNFVAPAHVCYLSRWFASLLTIGRLPVADVYGFGGEDPACFVMWGCNITEYGAADGMCGGLVRQAVDRAEKLIVVDPRRTSLAERADHFLQLRPGTEGALALAMLNTVIAEDLIDQGFVEGHTSGFPELVDHVRSFTPEWAAPITRVAAADIRAAARTYATTLPGCIQWGSATDMSAASYQTARSLVILRALVGNLDRPGGDVLWVPPEGVRQKSTFVNPDQRGEQFLPSQKRSVSAGRFTLDLVAHPRLSGSRS